MRKREELMIERRSYNRAKAITSFLQRNTGRRQAALLGDTLFPV